MTVDSDEMKAQRVGERINNVRNNDGTLSKPVEEDEDGQTGLFATSGHDIN